jgi:hypothetical protein
MRESSSELPVAKKQLNSSRVTMNFLISNIPWNLEKQLSLNSCKILVRYSLESKKRMPYVEVKSVHLFVMGG